MADGKVSTMACDARRKQTYGWTLVGSMSSKILSEDRTVSIITGNGWMVTDEDKVRVGGRRMNSEVQRNLSSGDKVEGVLIHRLWDVFFAIQWQ